MKYYGPFPIIQKVGTVAYKLALPDGAKIHSVVHVSQLKKHIPASVSVEDDITQVPSDPGTAAQPVQFIGEHMIVKGASAIA